MVICLAVAACSTALAGRVSLPILDLPPRDPTAIGGADFMLRTADGDPASRQKAVREQILAGNVPAFLRTLVPIHLQHRKVGEATIWVTADVLAVGSDTDHVRSPLGGPEAVTLARALNCWLPTPRIVDAIYAQAKEKLPPIPMRPTAQMTGNQYFIEHHRLIETQRGSGASTRKLTAGHKKDVVLSPRLGQLPGRVAIYGWHKRDGSPIQPLSTVHSAHYADYSHGIRLVWGQVDVNGQMLPFAQVLADEILAPLLSHEGAFDPDSLIATWLDQL